MKSEQQIEWNNKFEGVLPIDFQLKHVLHHRWFRIHCLPKSKRYAENETEYGIIKTRQNQILTDVIGESIEIKLLIGLYNYDNKPKPNVKTDLGTFNHFMSIDLHQNQDRVSYGPYDKGDSYETYIMNTIMDLDNLVKPLRQIANDAYDYRLSIVNLTKGRIVIPYDGGVDIIMENEKQRNIIKPNYQDWLSIREDGM